MEFLGNMLNAANRATEKAYVAVKKSLDWVAEQVTGEEGYQPGRISQSKELPGRVGVLESPTSMNAKSPYFREAGNPDAEFRAKLTFYLSVPDRPECPTTSDLLNALCAERQQKGRSDAQRVLGGRYRVFAGHLRSHLQRGDVNAALSILDLLEKEVRRDQQKNAAW